MPYKLVPLLDNVVIEPIKPKDIRLYTGKVLADVETKGMDVLQYGKIAQDGTHINNENFKAGDIVLYERLASHKTNIGETRLVLVNIEHIQGRLEDAN